ncbi:site-specific integrase [Shewanella septentrionalis]|uniref:Site-specific integrase n=1 Tax=Shewanella septentrionalis TaxID=2952223 RepID=A0A9X2WY87_9GAMM|nr:site-specific integrase [Shewanella septentrionalis]MCT7947949.1 site-specific integrase [Shewanella septentrionalis]
MYSVSYDVAKFEQYAFPSMPGSFPMPCDETVVSVDKDGNPVSYFKDDIWDFNAFFNLTNESKSLYQINFHPKKHNPDLLIELKQRIYFLIWGSQGSLLHMEGDAFRKFSHCHDLARWSNAALRVFKGTPIDSFPLLSNELVFGQLLYEGKKHSEETVSHRLKALSVLTQLNQHFPEPRRFSLGLPEGKTIKTMAKQYSAAGRGHYPTVIPVIYEQLMGRLIENVTTAHNKLEDLGDVKAYAKKYVVTERQAYDEFRAIGGACFMTLSAFTGMRISELTQIDSTSYKEVDLDGIKLCTLRSWTRKLDKLPREDAWACAPICKKALEVLTVLNDSYRSNKGSIHCSPRFRLDGSSGMGDNISSQLEDVVLNKQNLSSLFAYYSKHLDITYDPDEMDEVYGLLNPVVPAIYNPIKERGDGSIYWHFTTHSLRRTFAHFVVGNGLVSLAALKHQFKHIRLSMTAIYASHAEVLTLLGIDNPANIKKAVEDAEMESHKAYLRNMIGHPGEQSGGFMKVFEGDPRVMTEDQFEELAQKTKGANKSTGYGRCFAGFKCKMEHLFEQSSCLGRDCENLNINKEEALRWQARHGRIAARLQQMKEMGFYNQNTLARELTDIRAAEKVMRDHDIEFKRFELGAL